MAVRKARSFKPKPSGDNVLLAVVIEIAHGRALAEKLAFQFDLGIGGGALHRGAGNEQGSAAKKQDGCERFHSSILCFEEFNCRP